MRCTNIIKAEVSGLRHICADAQARTRAGMHLQRALEMDRRHHQTLHLPRLRVRG